ncbi:hypothetical protein RchiOBHm_Chr4g0410681 [Rosa chinensis]|uniref:Uncharacterized protein n=1 Tax=Rosa chinensis TaxID=74649 RepID=A0A2P6QVF1_ROSCH|nr:hypothetical protein RchiOBHm_Chr4g0410681 [Rosa chinensis]
MTWSSLAGLTGNHFDLVLISHNTNFILALIFHPPYHFPLSWTLETRFRSL